MVEGLHGYQLPGFSTAVPVVHAVPAMAAVVAEPVGPPRVQARLLAPGDQLDRWQLPSGQLRLPVVQMLPKSGCCPAGPGHPKPEGHYPGNQTLHDQLPCQPVAVAVEKQVESRRKRRRCNWPAPARWRRQCSHLRRRRGCLVEHPTNLLLGCRSQNHPENHPEDSPVASLGQQHPEGVHQSARSQACLAFGTREACQAAFVGGARCQKPARRVLD